MKNQIMVESYSPLGHGRLMDKDVKDIILPKASSMPHMLGNMKYPVKMEKEALILLEEVYNNLKFK